MFGAARRVHWGVLVVALLISFVLKLTLALNTYGTNDVVYWEESAKKISVQQELNLYREGNNVGNSQQAFNHPPFMLRVLHAWDLLAGVSGLSLRFWMRLTSSLADVASVLLIWIILYRDHAPPWPGLIAMALAPVSILISGFHGNTDPIMVMFILLAIYCVECRAAWMLAGVAFGLALCVKVVPLVLLPAFLLYLPNWTARRNFALASTFVVLVLSLPILLEDPAAVIKAVLGYSGNTHDWGIGRILFWFANINEHWRSVYNGYASYGKFILLPAVAALGLWMNSLPVRPRLFTQCGIVLFFFLTLSPGFGVQYLAWLIPWVVAFGLWPALAFHLSTGMYLFCVYNFWSGGIPWYYADGINAGPRPWPLKVFEMICWVTVSCSAMLLLRQVKIASSQRPGDKRTLRPAIVDLPEISGSGISPGTSV